MKGFKKDGKFRPTQKRYKPSLRKEDVKSFEDSHADNLARQLESRRMLLLHKETLDMHECTLCDQQFDSNDPLFDIRVGRHVLGMHSKNRTIYSERTGSPSTPMGNHTYGDAKFVPEKEKRSKKSFPEEKDVFDRIENAGYKITTETVDLDPEDRDDEDEPETYTSHSFEVSEEEVLSVMNGERTAEEMIDELTGTSGDERLLFKVSTGIPLFRLTKEGKAHVDSSSGEPIWKKGKE